MTVVKFPTSIPSAERLELPRAQLVGLLHALSETLLQNANDLMAAENAPELGAVVHRAAAALDEAARGWASLSATVRDSWGVRK